MPRVFPVALIACLALGLGIPVGAQSIEQPMAQDVISQSEAMATQFVNKASAGNLAEVSLGQLASQKGSPAVQQLGQRLAQDHSKANQQLAQIAGQMGVAMASGMMPEHQATAQQLSQLSGPAFDRQYLSAMLKDHQKDIAEYERFAAQTDNQQLRQYAINQLPILRTHLQMVQSLMGSQPNR